MFWVNGSDSHQLLESSRLEFRVWFSVLPLVLNFYHAYVELAVDISAPVPAGLLLVVPCENVTCPLIAVGLCLP